MTDQTGAGGVEALLAEHEYIAWDADFWECACGWRSEEPEFYEPEQHRTHLAAVLAAYVTEQQAVALDGAADQLDANKWQFRRTTGATAGDTVSRSMDDATDIVRRLAAGKRGQ